MANRDFNTWLSTMKDSIATWTYYTDFEKVYENVQKVKVELNILNSLIGSKNIADIDAIVETISKCFGRGTNSFSKKRS